MFLFDVGGTLLTYDEERRAQLYAERAASVGVHVKPETALPILERLNLEIPERMRGIQLSLLPLAEQRAFWVDLWADGFRELGVASQDALRLADELLDSSNGADMQRVFPDVVPALDALTARGKRLGVISNFSPNCEPLLAHLGLAKYFQFFVVSGILGIEKPDRRIFDYAVRASGRSVSELVYVGDNVYHDFDGARGAGMDAILIDRGDRHPDLQGARIRDLRELMRF